MRIARLANPFLEAVVGKDRLRNRTPLPAQRDGRHRSADAPAPVPDAARTAKSLVFLELSGPLIAGTAPVLTNVVTHRVLTPPPSAAAILDLCGITEFDDAGRTALVRLRRNLAARDVELHLTAAHDVLDDLTDVDALAPAVHPAVRVAILAAYEAVPGPAIVTPPIRELFDQAFEAVTLVPDDGANTATPAVRANQNK